MLSAASTCETLSGSRNSFRSILAFKPEDDAIVFVHANRVTARAIGSKRVKPITGRHTKIFELGDGIDLIELPPNDWP